MVKLKPDDPEGYIQLALCRVREKKLDAAKQAALKAIELEPALPRAHFLLGVVYDAMGKKKAARAAFKKAVQLDPNFKAAKSWLRKNR
jgi:Tfp pilus assembly protein PilF